jgi:aerobic carbon-monoxide dehydrogenase medium subunit
MNARYAYHRPKTLTEAFKLHAAVEGARYIAGGTDLMVRLHDRALPAPPLLISLRGIKELRGIRCDEAGARIGALTTIAELLLDSTLCQRYPALAAAARRLGSPQIRNAATVGGNLCNASPCADTAPPLMVYEAEAELRGPRGTRRLSLEELFVGPGQTPLERSEVLAALLLPPPGPATRARFLKKGRVQMDLAVASVAVLLELEPDWKTCARARLAAGSVGPTPLRLRAVESLLEGEQIVTSLLSDAQRLASRCVAPITDIRSTEAYRRQLIGVYVRRLIEEIMEEVNA